MPSPLRLTAILLLCKEPRCRLYVPPPPPYDAVGSDIQPLRIKSYDLFILETDPLNWLLCLVGRHARNPAKLTCSTADPAYWSASKPVRSCFPLAFCVAICCAKVSKIHGSSTPEVLIKLITLINFGSQT